MAAQFLDIDEEEITFLKREWDKLISFYTSDTTLMENTFLVLTGKYREENRFYHNLSHVKALLTLFESLKDKVSNPNAVRFSIWFHDVIYDSQRNDNEEESAKFAFEMLGKLQVGTETLENVQDLILATKHHDGSHRSHDAKLFLDMDLAILGSSEERYREYSQAIRKEYAWVTESAYREGRQKVLKHFIERDKIYFTDEMQGRYEKLARKNIQAEIETLTAQTNTSA